VSTEINLFAPNPKGSKLIFGTPFRTFRDGANDENKYLKIDKHAGTYKKILILIDKSTRD